MARPADDTEPGENSLTGKYIHTYLCIEKVHHDSSYEVTLTYSIILCNYA